MKCRYCKDLEINQELVEHIILVHPNLILYYVIANMPVDSKYNMLLDVFPDFKKMLE
jgi:hypothetical protein